MPAKPSGEIKTGTIRKKQKNGDIYIYRRKTVYVPEKKYNRVLESELIGKIPKDPDEPVPARAGHKKAAARGSRKGGLHAGMMDVIDYFGRTSGIDADLYAAADRYFTGGWGYRKDEGRDIAEKAVSLARYLLATDGQDLLGVQEWKYSHALPCRYGVSERVSRWVLNNVSNKGFRDYFFEERCRRLGAVQVVAYLLKGMPDDPMRWSGTHHSSGGRDYMVYYADGQPVAFMDAISSEISKYSLGSVDINSVSLKKREFVIAEGCCTQQNLAVYLVERVPFITPVDTGLEWVRREIDANKKKLMSKKSVFIPGSGIHGVTVMRMHQFGGRLYMHLYYSPVRYVEGRVRGKDEYGGYFALVSKRKNSPAECFRKYRANERAGYFFEAGKQHVDSERLCARGRWEKEGLMFVQFLALCYCEYILGEIHKFRPSLGKPNGNPAHDTPATLSAEERLGEWLDRTPVYRQLQWFGTDAGQDHADATALKKLYLEKIGMDVR